MTWAEAQEGRTSLMSDYPAVRGSRSGEPHPRLRLAALAAVITGVLLVAAAAFLLSYTGIHQIALQAGVSPTLARLYPVMFDAMLVIACSAALALRSAGWPTRLYVWLSLLVLLAAVAAGDALYATTVSLPIQPTQAVVAIIPWVLLLMGFVMWLLMLRHWRRVRAAAAANAIAGEPAGQGVAAGPATVTWAAGRGGAGAVAGAQARAGAPRAAIDTLLEPRTQWPPEPAVSGASRPAAKDDAGGTRTGLTYEAGTPEAGTYEAGTPEAGTPADDTMPEAGSETSQAGTGAVGGVGTTGDHSSPPPMVPAPTPVPHFDRMRSTPTPPQDPEADEE